MRTRFTTFQTYISRFLVLAFLLFGSGLGCLTLCAGGCLSGLTAKVAPAVPNADQGSPDCGESEQPEAASCCFAGCNSSSEDPEELENSISSLSLPGNGSAPSCCLLVGLTREPATSPNSPQNSIGEVTTLEPVSLGGIRPETFQPGPVRHFPDLEQTYLRCCVFLI